MTNALRKVMYAVFALCCAAVLSLTALLGSACTQPEEQPKQTYTLTFETDGGTEIPPITAEAGAAITPPENPTKTNYRFDGWYLTADFSGDPAEIPAVMPEENRTYYAHWTEDSTPPDNPPDDPTHPEPTKAKVYLALAGGTIADGQEYYELEADSDLYAFAQEHLPEKTGYRFHGWTLGGAPLSEGAKMPETDVTLTAVWEVPFTVQVYLYDYAEDEYAPEESRNVNGFGLEGDVVLASEYAETIDGYLFNAQRSVSVTLVDSLTDNIAEVYYDPVTTEYSDLFHGEDTLAVVGNELWLIRETYGKEKAVSFDPQTGLFAFGTEDDLLAGKLVGDMFFYFRDLSDKTFSRVDAEGTTLETLRFGENDEATYTDEAGTQHKGTYTVDLATGEYYFESADAEFHFALSASEAETLLFLRETGTERGYYYSGTEELGNLLFFDGILDADGVGLATSYLFRNGTLTTEFIATYYWDADYEEYCIIFGIDAYYLRTTEGAGTVAGIETRGSFMLNDGYAETYYLDPLDEDSVGLILDGYHTAYYLGESGELEQGTYDWGTATFYVYDYSTGQNVPNVDSWVEVTTESGETLYYRLSFDYGYRCLPMTARPTHADWNIGPAAIYEGYVEYLPEHAMFYYYADGIVYIYSWYHDTFDDVDVFEVIDYGYYEPTDVEGEYSYLSVVYSDEYSDFGFDFRVTENGVEIGYIGMLTGTDEWEIEEGVFSVDKYGYVTYDDKNLLLLGYTLVNDEFDYNYSLYVFELSDGSVVTYLITYDEEYNPILTRLTDESLVPIVYRAFYGQNTGFDRLLFLSETEAAIGLLDIDGFYLYYLKGEVTPAGAEGEYLFTIDPDTADSFLEALGGDPEIEAIISLYESFRFKYGTLNGEPAVFYYVEEDKLEVTADAGTVETDGYGSATYTPAGGAAAQYSYEFLEGNLLCLSSDIESVYLLFDDDRTTFVPAGPEAGAYFYFFGDGTIYLSAYVALLGDEAHTAYLLGDKGTYEILGTLTYNGQPGQEYRVTVDGESICILTVTVSAGDRSYPIFIERTDSGVGEFRVGRNGYLRGDGYNIATYNDGTTTYYGMMTVCDLYDNSYLYENYGADPNPEGMNVLFFVYSYSGGYYEETDILYIFDLSEDRTTAELRPLQSGCFALFERGRLNESETVYLDGHGNATLYIDGEKSDEGTYLMLDDGTFVYSGEETFSFRIAQYSLGNDAYFVYARSDEETVYVLGDRSVLRLGSFMEGLWIDHYGAAIRGNYSFMTDKIVSFETAAGDIYYFEVGENDFSLITDDFIIEDGVLYAYQGPSVVETLTIPAGVKRIGSDAFVRLSYVAALDLADVEIIDPYAFAYIEDFYAGVISSEKLKEIGAYAFYGLSAINTLDLPAAVTIGDYAFYGCHNLSQVKLRDIAYIGEFAFTHNDSLGNMILDLTEADLTKLEIAPTAFRALHYNTLTDGMLPMTIYVTSVEALNALYSDENWAALRGMISVQSEGEDLINGFGFYSFITEKFYRFTDGALYQVEPPVEQYYGAPGVATFYALYVIRGGRISLYTFQDDVWTDAVSFEADATSIELDGTLYYKGTDYEHPVIHTLSDGGNEFGFELTFSWNVDGYYEGVGVYNAYFNGDPVYGTYLEMVNGFSFEFETDNGVYRATVTFGDEATLQLENSGIVATTLGEHENDKSFRATFSMGQDGKLILTKLERYANGYFQEMYNPLIEEDETEENAWTVTRRNGYDVYVYAVRYVAEADGVPAHITVELKSASRSVEIETAPTDTQQSEPVYRVTILVSESGDETTVSFDSLELGVWTEWSADFGWYEWEEIEGTVSADGLVFTLTAADAVYTITVTEEEGVYSATVTVVPAE